MSFDILIFVISLNLLLELQSYAIQNDKYIFYWHFKNMYIMKSIFVS